MKNYSIQSLLILLPAAGALAQISITGVTDESTYADQVSFTVEQEAGHLYDARLDGDAVPVGSSVQVMDVDYHELLVLRTNEATMAAERRLVQFVVRASERSRTEIGLPAHVPYPVVPSAPAEFAGAELRVMAPARYPQGMAPPIVAWVMDASNHPVRVNGLVTAPGQASFALMRGAGSGFLDRAGTAGAIDYSPAVGGLSAHRTIHIDSNTTWTAVQGSVSGVVTWPEDARIDITGNLSLTAGATLTIGAGSIVRVGPGVDITNEARVVIHGTLDRPVVFAPVSPNQPWGGFIMPNSAGSVSGSGVIFTGSGADPNWFGSGGNPGSHRKEQGLFFCGGDNTITLTDAAAVSLAGQLGHSVSGGDITLTRFLLQRATTGGEYTGASFVVNDSAFIEFPADTDEFEDGDHDAIYIVNGTHGFTNTLFGWAKDDGVDSGKSGAGLLNFESCWFEGIFHEGNALSGTGKIVNHRRGVFLNCGQGLESGYDGPEGLLDACLAIGNQTGGRFGDNYDWSYSGTLTVTNSILVNNHRDVWGMTWNDWAWRTNQMFVGGNRFSSPLPEHPGNLVWDPAADGWRLAAFMSTPPSAPVGVGLAVRSARLPLDMIKEDVPIGLSSFSTNTVSVNYAYQASETTVASGTIAFMPGEMLKTIPAPPGAETLSGLVRLVLTDAVHGEITGLREVWYVEEPVDTLVSMTHTWRYYQNGSLDGVDWTAPDYDDSAWPEGPALLYHESSALPAPKNTELSLTRGSGERTVTYYFRTHFTFASDPVAGTVRLSTIVDDGCLIYLNGTPVHWLRLEEGSSPEFSTLTEGFADNATLEGPFSVPGTALVQGDNVLAVEVHQSSLTSSDMAFGLQLDVVTAASIRYDWFGSDWVLYWPDDTFTLESAPAMNGPWGSLGAPNPYVVEGVADREFFRLRQP